MIELEQRRGPNWGRTAPGECRLSQRDGQIVIERADPQVWLEDEFLRRLVGPAQNRNEWVSLTYQPHDLCRPQQCCQRFREGEAATSSAGWHCYYGGILSIRASNATVMYRIGGFLRGGFWEAQLVSG